MKHRILVIIFCLFAYVLNAQTTSKATWDFPFNPSTPKWKELKSYEEQLLAYNIPEGIIKEISTSELVQICLAYPEWGVIDAFNDRRMGLNNVMSHFNGFHELFIRNDAAKELIKVYAEMAPLAIGKDWDLLQKGNYSFQINCIELLLSHDMIIKKLDERDTQSLLDEVVLKYMQKKQLPDVYSLWGLSPTAGLCLSLLDKDGNLSRNDTKFLSLKRSFMSENIEVLNGVIELAYKIKIR